MINDKRKKNRMTGRVLSSGVIFTGGWNVIGREKNALTKPYD